MTPLLIGLLAAVGVGLGAGAAVVGRRRRWRVRTLVWDPASRAWVEVAGRAGARGGRV